MALGKAVGAKALKLFEGSFSELRWVAVRDHALHELVVEMLDAVGELERPHGAPKLVGFRGGEPGRDDRNLHRLLLEERHPEGLLEHALERFGRISDRLPPFAAPKIGMDHVALNRAGPDNRDFDDEIVLR